jgi:hypothetical protein
MPALGAVGPANLRVQACAELGLSCKLVQPWRVEPHPRGGGSSGHPVWIGEKQLMRDVTRCATPAVGADCAAPVASTSPSTTTSRLSAQVRTEGAMLNSDGVSALMLIVAAFTKRGDLLIMDKGMN